MATLFVRAVNGVLVSTSPPFSHLAGLMLQTLRSIPFVWWVMDLNPDQLVAAGRLKPTSVLSRLLDTVNRSAFRRAFGIIVLDRFMRKRVLAKGAIEKTLHTIRPCHLPMMIYFRT